MKIIEKKLEDHSVECQIIFKTTKPQLFFIPKEESQVFTSRDALYTDNPFTGMSNNPFQETVNNEPATNNSTLNASWNATDYIGSVAYNILSELKIPFAEIKILQISTGLESVFESSSFLNVLKTGINKLTIPPQFLNLNFTPEGASDAVPQYGDYLISITPKFIETSIFNIRQKRHFQPDQLTYGATQTILGDGLRRTIVSFVEDDFKNTDWDFTTYELQSGRLMGSLVEILDNNGTVKSNKVIAEQRFDWATPGLTKRVQAVLTPDNFGFDSTSEKYTVGDKLRIYPRETYFNPIHILLTYVPDSEVKERAYKFLLNDAVRDITTGTYEIYDKNGVTVSSEGTFEGKVLQRYQIQQLGQYEIRKRINENG